MGKGEAAAHYLDEFKESFIRRITFGREPEPGEAMRWLVHVNPYRREEDSARLTAAVRLAGLDEAKPSVPSSLPVTWPIANTFRRKGELWTVAFDHQEAQIQERKGFHDIAQLLSRPLEEIHSVPCRQPP